MERGRPPKPQALKALQGTDRPDRKRAEIAIEKLGELPKPPSILSEYGKREWLVVGGYLFRMGLLAATDLDPLAKYCNEAAEYWEINALIKASDYTITYSDEIGNQTKVVLNPLLSARSMALTNSRAYLSLFGITPAMRAKLAPPPAQEDKDPFDETFG